MVVAVGALSDIRQATRWPSLHRDAGNRRNTALAVQLAPIDDAGFGIAASPADA